MKIHNRVKIIASILIFAVLLYTATYFLSDRLSHLITDQSTAQKALYFTDVFPNDLTWADNQNLLFLQNGEIHKFNIRKRKLKKIDISKTEGNDNLVEITKMQDGFLLRSFTQIIPVNRDLQIVSKLNHQNDSFTLDYPYLCVTKNFSIDNPEQIATEITIFAVEANKPQEMKSLQSSLTLKPLTCNPKQLTLIPSDPRLELIIYNWELSKKSPKALKLENPITEPIHNVQTNPEKTLLYIQSRNGDLFLYDIKKQELTNPTKNFKDTYWNPLPDKRLLSLAALQTGTELTIYNNINQQDKESEKTAYKLETPVDFISASPSPNLKNFALIDTNGELWIYQINR